ncbi:hypothetical protein SAMN05216503_0491 [Polaribacter sp. KT25b]|uniref:hypothetical protein n=1 Tax=Polaribacter sp. KT25b TaxID=1855336 RepID=UPI00087AC8A4|nr:hypothetical protein [Polaribacter sp. KT25b]SDR70018.1 hypothetical protein SAMN05216503_0491 [Polaribacter sp. KT25b]
MMNFIKTYVWILFPFIFLSGSLFLESPQKEIRHTILVSHPGEKTKISTTLVEVQNENGLPIKYYTDVESVICLEKVCKVIPVRIIWNNLGEYQEYKLKEGEILEKYEDDFFESKDYIKLQSILSNQASPFKEVFIEDVLTVPNENDYEEVDAISGATALELDEKDTVPGAALTCYTLWHWANGNLVSVIKSITAKSASTKQLQDFLVDKNNAYYSLAIYELKVRREYKKSIINATIDRVLQDDSLLKSTFEYINLAPSEIYFFIIKEVFFKGKKEQKLAAIKSLKYSSFKISKTFLDNFSQELTSLKSFQEVTALLELIQDKNLKSVKVIENVVPLLNRDFLIARRAYWFLKNKKLLPSQELLVRDFYNKNKEKL